jgi:hypothetical protein
MNRMSKGLVFTAALAAVVSVGQSAWSGKPENDKIAELEPKVAAAKTSLKASCGCDIGVVVKWDMFKKAEDMGNVDVTLGNVTRQSKEHCETPADKQKMCSNLSGFELWWNEGPKNPEMQGKTMKLYMGWNHQNGFSAPGKLMDKF